jgi:hypothetical protein
VLAQAKFDSEYLYLRKLVLRGKFSVGDARLWMIAKAEAAVQATVVEKLDRMSRYPVIDRDMLRIRKCMGELGIPIGEDEND